MLTWPTCFLWTSPHHSFIRVLHQETNGHQRQTLLGVCVDWNPPRVTLVHFWPAYIQHAGDTRPTEVNVENPNLNNTEVHKTVSLAEDETHQTRRCWSVSAGLTFLPACLRAKASSVVIVLFPTPPFPDRTNTTWRTWARLPSHMKQRRYSFT